MDIRAKVEARKAELLRTLQQENFGKQREVEGERSRGPRQEAKEGDASSSDPIREAQVRGLMEAELEEYIKKNYKKHISQKDSMIGMGLLIACLISFFIFWPLGVLLFFAAAIYAVKSQSSAKLRLREGLARGWDI